MRYARCMAVRKRSSGLPVQDDLLELVALRKKHQTLMVEVAALRDAGKVRLARAAFKDIETIWARIKAIEDKHRPKRWAD